MAKTAEKSGLVARRYASALIALAADRNVLSEVERDIAALAEAMAETPAFGRALANPRLGAMQQARLVDALAIQAQLNPLTGRFLAVLVRNRRLGALGAMLDASLIAFAARRGSQVAEVRSAAALTPEQTVQLQDKIAKELGHAVTLNVTVDRSLLGGLVVTVGSKQIDDSVKHKLERLSRALKANENSGSQEKAAG